MDRGSRTAPTIDSRFAIPDSRLTTHYPRSPAPHDVFRDSPPDVAHPVGAQAALLPHDVRHRLGRGIAAAAGGTGRGLPLRQSPRVELAGRRHHVRLSRTRSGGRRQHELRPQLQPYRPGLSRHPERSAARAGCRAGAVAPGHPRGQRLTATPTARSAAFRRTTTSDPLPAAGRRALVQSGRRIAEAPGRRARRRDAEEPVSRPAGGRQLPFC